MRASFVIVNYNRKDELLITISKTKELVSRTQGDFEIVVVDNGSADGSIHAVESQFPEVVLIKNPVNTGAPAWNLGFEKAKGKYLIIIDDDSHIVSGLEEALDYMDIEAGVGLLALNITTGPYTTADFKWKHLQDVVGFLGCGAIFRRSVYEKIGGYAEWIFLYANEWELALRCWSAGYSVRYFEKSNVNHRASKIHRTSKRLRVLSTRNELGIAYKHFGHNRWTYIFRMYMNTLKRIKVHGIKNTYYDFLGGIEFLKMRKSLDYTPVTKEAQDFFVENYTNTFPVFDFIKRRITPESKK